MKKAILKNLRDAIVCLAFCAAVGLILGCPIKKIFGVPCPGCGMTRGYVALLRLDFREALRWHPLCPLVPVVFAIYVFKDAIHVSDKTRAIAFGALAAIFVGVYAVRLWLYFPDVAPMNFDTNSVLGKILNFFYCITKKFMI